MGSIFVIIGKSATGKDTLYARILSESGLNLNTIVSYTTRPIRSGEENGREYWFLSVEEMEELERQGKIIEHRAYNTVHGIWNYFTVDDGQIKLMDTDYLLIMTLEGYLKLRNYFETVYRPGCVVPIYIEVSDRERMHRALRREDAQKEPKYRELCRRYLADDEDFSDENINKAGIMKRYSNMDGEICYKEIVKDIRDILSR